MGKFLVIATGLLVVVGFILLLSLLFIKIGWSLFMVPVFNLPEITWLQAFGLSLLAGAFKSYNYGKKD